jgi:glycosyltransferase involved in cell wall biosynthesis
LKIRVLQIVTRLAVRGVPYHVLNLAAGLDKRRYETAVLAGRSDPGEGSLLEDARSRGIAVIELPLLQRQIDPMTDVRAFAAVYRLLRSGRYHLVHTHISKAGFIGRLAARCAGVPVVVHTYHGWAQEVHDESAAGRVLLACEKLAARASDAVIAVSDSVVEDALANGIGTRPLYSVVPNGIDLTRFQRSEVPSDPSVLEGKPLVGAVGSMTSEKGFEVLLDAMVEVKRGFPHARLFVIGDGPLRADLENQAGRLELGETVKFLGRVEDVRSWLYAFDIVVQPSLREGQGLALLEAMAAGCPVIASRVGGIPDFVEDHETGLLIPPGDSGALAGAICQLAGDEKRRQALARSGRERVRSSYSLERMIGGVETLYESLLAAKSLSQ